MKRTKTKWTTELFIAESKKIHGKKYLYHKVEYKTMHDRVCITDLEYGDWWQIPYDHLSGKGNPKRANNITYTREEYINMAIKRHGTDWDYNKVVYVNMHTDIEIVDPETGKSFWQHPQTHLCFKGKKAKTSTKPGNLEEFIEKSRKIHGERYNYDKTVYKNRNTKVCSSPEYGEFWTTPNSHIHSQTGHPKRAKKCC